MPAALLVQPNVTLDPAQREALAAAAVTLPDAWTVIVSREGLSGDRFNVFVMFRRDWPSPTALSAQGRAEDDLALVMDVVLSRKRA